MLDFLLFFFFFAFPCPGTQVRVWVVAVAMEVGFCQQAGRPIHPLHGDTCTGFGYSNRVFYYSFIEG